MDKTVGEMAEVAERMSNITSMLEAVFTYMLQEGVDEAAIDGIRLTLADLHAEERGATKEDGPYPESTIRVTYVASIVFRELAKFLDMASREFVVDYEIQHGGDS
jgi:hypothetical protein